MNNSSIQFRDKDEHFVELQIFEKAFNSIKQHQKDEEKKLAEKYSYRINDKNYQSEKRALEKQFEISRELESKIRSLINEYKNEVNKINAFQNNKMNLYMAELHNDKLKQKFGKEDGVIRRRKIQIREDLLKILKDKNLSKVMTGVRVDGRLRSIHANEATGKHVIGSGAHYRENLGSIVTTLEAEKIADQLVTEIEQKSIESSGVNVITNKENSDYYKGKIVSTPGQNLRVSPDKLHDGLDVKDNGERAKADAIEAIIKSNNEKVGEEAAQRISNSEIRKLQITQEEYIKLSDVRLEFARVQEAIAYMTNDRIDQLYPNTKILLINYQKQLLEQIKKLEISTEKKANEANLDKHMKNLEKEQHLEKFEQQKAFLESKIHEAQMYNDRASEIKYENMLREHEESYESIFGEEENQRTR